MQPVVRSRLQGGVASGAKINGRSEKYFLRLSNGERPPLSAPRRESAFEAALGHFGAALESEDPAPGQSANWEKRVYAMQVGNNSARWQVEAIKRYRGVGDLTCRKLCGLVGKATIEGVLSILRGKSRVYGGEIMLILNRAQQS